MAAVRRRPFDPPADERQQLLVAWAGEVLGGEQSVVERRLHEAHEGQRRGAHRVVPVDVPVHLVLREEERLQRADSLLAHREFERPPIAFAGDRERRQQPVHVHGPVGHPAEERVAAQVVDLVEVQRAGDQSLQRVSRGAADEGRDARGGVGAVPLEDPPDRHRRHEARGDLLVMARDRFRPEFLDRVRKRIVPDVVKKRSEAHDRQLVEFRRAQGCEVSVTLEAGDRPRHEMVHPERVEEAVVDTARIHEMREPELLDAPESLKLWRVEDLGRVGFDVDVPPQGIADRTWSRHGIA